jgi:hypothetical protein
MAPASAKRRATSPMRRMFSARSSALHRYRRYEAFSRHVCKGVTADSTVALGAELHDGQASRLAQAGHAQPLKATAARDSKFSEVPKPTPALT